MHILFHSISIVLPMIITHDDDKNEDGEDLFTHVHFFLHVVAVSCEYAQILNYA